jgi:hypothetical protein
MVREIMDRAGRNITNPVLRLVNGVSLEKVNKHQVHQLIDVVMEGAKRPDPIKLRAGHGGDDVHL